MTDNPPYTPSSIQRRNVSTPTHQMMPPHTHHNGTSSSHSPSTTVNVQYSNMTSSSTSLEDAMSSFDSLVGSLRSNDIERFKQYVQESVEFNMRSTNLPTPSKSRHPNLNYPNNSNTHNDFLHSILSYDYQQSVRERFTLLAGLLLLQSFSSFILSYFSFLLEHHIVITLYLTMLVGAGGNTSNISAVHIIRGIALKDPQIRHQPGVVIARECVVAMCLGLLMVVLGFARVKIVGATDGWTALTISTALFVIVVVSSVLGCLLPIILDRVLRIDSAHAGPILQVIMDVMGVALTCCICQAMLPMPELG